MSGYSEYHNHQLTEKGLKAKKASATVVYAIIIETADSKQRWAIEVDDNLKPVM